MIAADEFRYFVSELNGNDNLFGILMKITETNYSIFKEKKIRK